MSKGMKRTELTKSAVTKVRIDPTECPFREFRDNELSVEFWGMGPAAFRATSGTVKAASKPSVPSGAFHAWLDEQTQPLPRSVRHYLHGWMRAEELAMSRWEAEVVVFEEINGGKMSIIDIQLSHAQVMLRSSFCRKVMSACFMLERVDNFSIEHQWESFSFALGPEGWRAKNHIYCPGMKPGGGTQHRPGLSRNGCYLVRLYYLGAWRCVWVNDKVPVDANDSPLLPFSPLLSHPPLKTVKQVPATVTEPIVHLWPLLICKALLKIAAPDMNSDEDTDCVEDELMPDFDILHALTGAVSLVYLTSDYEALWKLILSSEVPVFSWDVDDDATSTVKSKSTKKPSNKETVINKRTMVAVHLEDTKTCPPYYLPGITPAHEMALIIAMVRDIPLKKPLLEPEVALWKNYRWLDWARKHGLYEAYDCPRTRFLKVDGLLKLSYSPHLLDVQSTESINFCFLRENQADGKPANTKKTNKEVNNKSITGGGSMLAQLKEELREWVLFKPIQEIVKCTNVVYFPSLFKYTSAASYPPIRITKAAPNRSLDIQAPKAAPLYLQIDGPEENKLRISLSMLHPRILLNSGVPVVEYIERAYVLVEMFEWFIDCEIPKSKAFVQTRGYDSVEISFLPGRHFCRIWVHSRMNWQLALLSDSSLLLGTRDLIQNAAVHECPWAVRFLSCLGVAFNNWIRVNRSNTNIIMIDREFYTSYQPDLEWDPVVVGYTKSHVHWMFRKALQSLLLKRLHPNDFEMVCPVLRRYFCDPDFGLPPKPDPPISLRATVSNDPCDCLMPEVEEHWEAEEEFIEEQQEETDEKPIVSPDIMAQLLTPPEEPVTSQVCEQATEELPCGILKNERDKVIKMHEAATHIQAHWRGTWVRKCLKYHTQFNPEILKLIMENAFGNLEALSSLMNEFFALYPGAKYAYSVASALSGVYGLHQHNGTSPVTTICKWIPYFQGVFYCHAPVKVHFDVQSTVQHSTVTVYDNDTGLQMPQAYNAHITFEFTQNNYGYTVMGHGTLNQPAGIDADIHWQLSVLTSIDNVFHVCDNPENELCTPIPLPTAAKLHLGEMFIPNRRNILGGIQIAVTRIEAVRFRAAASSHDLEMEAILRTTNDEGEVKELARCQGIGEICWPFIRLKPSPPTINKQRSASHANLNAASTLNISARSQKGKQKPQSAGKSKSTTKMKDSRNVPVEPKIYTIQVIAPNGWPLPLLQWKRVDEVRNMLEAPKLEPIAKKSVKEKGSTAAKDKKEEKESKPLFTVHYPQPDDAYVELECSTAIGGGTVAKRDDDRDLEFVHARKVWGAKEPGRNTRGAQIRQEFRDEFLVAAAVPAVESDVFMETILEEATTEESNEPKLLTPQGPSLATESAELEMSGEIEEEIQYFTMPEQLKDKFVPLYFIPLCTREKLDHDSVLLTPDMAEAAKKERTARIDAALDRMRELQVYNEAYVLGRQKKRCHMLEQLSIDSQWSPELAVVLEERDNCITREILERNLSASKKKQDLKKK